MHAGLGFAAFAAIVLVAPSSAALFAASSSLGILEGSTLTLRLSTQCTELMARETATISANLTAGGVGVPGAQVTAFSLQGGTFTSPADLGTGEYVFSWTAPVVPTQTYVLIGVRASAEGYADIQRGIVFLVDPNRTNTLSPTTMFLRALPSSSFVRPGGTVAVSVYAFTIEGYRISGATMTASLYNTTQGSLSSVVPRGCGHAFTFTASSLIASDTSVLIRIIASKVGHRSVVASVGLTISP